MTKIKNTKKGMAKKTLSMSLVVAMLATSNVPVWAAEFSDGTDASVATEADAFAAEAPVVDDTEDAAPASVMVNEADITLNLSADSKKVVWGGASVISGTVTKTDGSEVEGGWQYRWVDEKGIAYASSNGKVDDAADMSLNTTADMAGKTLTLYVYDVDSNQQTLYDINTGISVAVEKRSLNSVTATPATTTKAYNGFAQTITEADGVALTVLDSENANVAADAYETSVTNATNNKEEFKLTVTAKEDSAYTGSAELVIGKVTAKAYAKGDILATATKGQSYQYTGKAIKISKDNITLKESASSNKGADGKLSGADLSAAVTTAQVEYTKVGDYPVVVYVDKTKLKNFTGADEYYTTNETVNVAKRDLSTAGTKITVNTLSGQIPTDIAVSKLADYLTFTGVEGSDLSAIKNSSKEYTLIVKNADGTDATEFKNGSTYTVTVRAKDGGNCTGEQTFTVVATAAALNAVSAKTQYTTPYTGDEIKPSKSDLGDLVIQYYNATGVPKTEDLGTDGYEITGYTNNVNATTVYDGNYNPVANAYVNIKITSGTYKDQTVSIPFLIKPLVVEADYVTVPDDVSINKALTEAGEYKLPVTVVAKDETGKKVEKTLTDSDFTVKYEYENKDIANGLFNNIITEVTVTNTNYILKTTNGKTRTVTASGKTEIVPKKLTDAMVVATPSTYTYTGGKIQPTYAVLDGAIALYKKGEVNDKDAEYEEVSISNAVNVGTGTITVQGYNYFYSGKATGTFTITAANTADVKVSIADQDYTGKQVRPRKFTATLNGNDVSNQFEIVSYGENVEAGVGTVVLKPLDGNKNFTGSNITASFNIVKEKVEATLNVYDSKGFDVTDAYTADVDKDADGNVNGVVHNSQTAFTFDGNEHTFAKALLSNIRKVTDDGVKTTAKESDFEIKYADNITGKKVTAGKENIGYIYAVAKEGTGFAGTKTIVTSDGTIINGVVAYIPFTIKSVEFVAKNVSVKNATYAAGLPVKPEVLIQIGGSTLVEGKDYTLRLIDKDGNTVTPIDVTVGDIYGVEIKGINGYTESGVATFDTDDVDSTAYSRANLTWGVDKKNINDCTVTVKDGVTTVLNGYLPVPATEYTSEKNTDGTYTVKANSTSKNYTGSKTVVADGKAEDEKPDAPMITKVNVTGNKATVVLSGDTDGAAGYDYVISTDRDCITNKDYDSISKNQVSTSTNFKYVQQGTYYAYCHAWKRDENGKKVFSDWSNAYPFVVSAITPDAPIITSVKVSGTTVKVTYKAAANATGYDVVLGTSSKKENGETRPYHYGDHKILNLKEGTVTATFKNVPKGSWTVGMHAFNRTSENGRKVFSPWSNLKKITVK